MAKRKENPERNKHLTLEKRQEIEDGLNMGMTFKAIAKHIQKDPTTVSYEIKHHRKEHRSGFTKTEEPCPLLLKAPFVCNGCKYKSSASCHRIRYLYRACNAQTDYKVLLHEAREGIPLNKEQFYVEDRIIKEGLSKGQHIYHIMASNDNFKSSKSSVYRNFKRGYYSAAEVDLPRAVKFKARKQKHVSYVPAGIKVGRSYDDFRQLVESSNLEHWVEIDTVIGREGGKVIMTLHFTACNFMIGLLLDNKTSAEAALKFTAFKDKLRKNGFSISDLMPVLLTDNGGEFSDAFAFENNGTDKEASLYYCDPMCSSQKPQIEKNHTLLRDILPKGCSFDDLTQKTVDLVFSHVNSVKRALYCGKSAYDMFSFLFSDELASVMGITRIPAAEVCQSRHLLDGKVDLKKGLTT